MRSSMWQRQLLKGTRCVIAMAVGFAAIGGSPAVSQEVTRGSSAQQPTYLLVFNKPGRNFARLGEMRELALQHRDMYLKWADTGEIIVSGRLEGEPVLGITVFRRGADEQAIRRALDTDPLVKAGVLEVEFRRWTIQMGALLDRRDGD
ncbi:MAG TPA: hypothetical protein VM308_04970 [Sphingomicrobium sp.]|nr:hypothetical protein [Sphingomicrobium sp.]